MDPNLLTEDDKNEVYAKLADAMLEGVETNALSEEETQKSSQYILTHLDELTTQQELLDLLEDVSSKWPAYKNVLLIAQEKNEKAQNEAQIQQAQEQLKILQ